MRVEPEGTVGNVPHARRDRYASHGIKPRAAILPHARYGEPVDLLRNEKLLSMGFAALQMDLAVVHDDVSPHGAIVRLAPPNL